LFPSFPNSGLGRNISNQVALGSKGFKHNKTKYNFLKNYIPKCNLGMRENILKI
jgi:hypothetical protein